MKKYFKHSIKNTISIKSILTIEYLELSTDYSFPEELHNFWELVYLDKGSIDYYIEGKPCKVCAGELLFLEPQQRHRIRADGKTATNIFVVCFECTSPAMRFFENYHMPASKHSRSILASIIEETSKTFVLPFQDKLRTVQNPNLGGEQCIRLYLELLLIFMLRKGFSKENNTAVFLNSETFSTKIADLVSDYLAENLYSHVTIDDICKNFNYSKTFLSKTFKDAKGHSIITHYNKLRIDEAKRLIRTTDDSMAKISNTMGFSDPKYFSHFFKNITKVTPTEYKNSIKKFD